MQKITNDPLISNPYDRMTDFQDPQEVGLTSKKNREQLLGTNERIQRTNQILANSQQQATDIEELGTDILASLYDQYSTMERTKLRLSEADENINRGTKILVRMGYKWYDPRYWIHRLVDQEKEDSPV